MTINVNVDVSEPGSLGSPRPRLGTRPAAAREQHAVAGRALEFPRDVAADQVAQRMDGLVGDPGADAGARCQRSWRRSSVSGSLHGLEGHEQHVQRYLELGSVDAEDVDPLASFAI
jgi:hypothetical protein